MISERDNPYSAPAAEQQKPARLKPWVFLAAAASFIIGFASFALGVMAVGIMSYLLWKGQPHHHETAGRMLAGCSLYLGFGAAWMFAGWCYWKQRFRHGLIATAVGLLIPGVLLAIFGV